ncbi:MAG: tetratricopeptide repeat protein [Deltaproteobacteria bacterium]|nr:tetratricopeptide repeat protein [Deltaproteobacteria bacterium]
MMISIEVLMPNLIRATVLCLCAMLAACTTTPVKQDDKSAGGGDDGSTTASVKAVVKAPIVSEEAKEAFSEAVRAYNTQKKAGHFDYDSLLQGFQSALDEDPKLAEAHYNLGCIYEAMRDDKNAEKYYKSALKLRGDLTLAAANWGGILARRGKLDAALRIYRRALSKDARNSPVLLNMAAIYKNQGKLKESLAAASKVLIRDPTNLGAYRAMASGYYAEGDMDMAQLICLRGLKIKESDPSLSNTLGLVLLRKKRVPEALAQFRVALSGQPDMVPTRFNIAKIALDYRDFRVARKEFAKILEYEPNNKKAAVGLGIAMRGTGDLDSAKAQFTALAGKFSKDPLPRQWLCRLQLRNLSNALEAKKECAKCIKLHRRQPADKHPCVLMYKEAVQSLEMDQKMKVAEAKAMEDQRKYEKKIKRLAKLRKDTVDKAWAKAKKECGILPPAKLEGEKIEFVLDPLAVPTEKKSKVRLVGAIFKGVKKIAIGTNKVKWRQINEHTLEMIVPKGLPLGAWDLLITFKDKTELYFQGGLWVGKESKCEDPKAKDGGKDKKKQKDKDKGASGEVEGKAKELGAKDGVEAKPGAKGVKAKPVKKDKKDKKADEPKDVPGDSEPEEPKTP